MSVDPQAFSGANGARVYRLPLEVFPGLLGYAHLLLDDGFAALVDCGSGFGDSNAQLEAGLRAVRERHGESVDWADLTHVLITHAHIDHFGGLRFVRQHTSAPVGIHELDLRVLTHYEQRLEVIDRRLAEFLADTGLESEQEKELLNLYRLHKHLFASVEVDFTIQAREMRVGPLEVIHVPGHCPGHVVFRWQDLLLAGDHVLIGISPHLAPERLSLNIGLGHYLESLGRVWAMAPSLRLTLPGHGPVIEDVAARIEAIEDLHAARLARVLDFASAPRTLAQISRELFPQASGYHGLLAIEEAGAHVEFLCERGYLAMDSDRAAAPRASRYVRLDPSRPPLPDVGGWRVRRSAVAAPQLDVSGHAHRRSSVADV
ncbi:MAG: MBL fold metallo-hydrolase [Anaerolineales bacterium]